MSLIRALCLAGTSCAMILVLGCKTAPPKALAMSPPATKEIPMIVEWPLLPAPREMEVTGAFKGLPVEVREQVDSVPEPLRGVFRLALQEFPLIAADRTTSASPAEAFTATIDAVRVPQPQGYVIEIGGHDSKRRPASIHVAAHDEAGLFYAAQTLRQIGRLACEREAVPVCQIADWPDFPNRGVMLDVARDKVPEMKTLYELVDLFASWKYNQLQLYTEHTFAYRGHHVVWEDASPMTPAQIRDLDQYCRERYMQLVPNQNSFGHMGRWLSHPEYAGLAETPDGSDLCPVDPRSIELLRSMYTFLLPNFSSDLCNVGCDETWSLGKGRSKDAVQERGVGRVYLEFLMKIHDLVTANGKTMQFWADIINNHPDLIPELPKDVIAMEWGYEANHPYAEHAKRFHDNGVRFYVVPGTSSWNSLLGRTENAIANLKNAAENGKANGSEGYLVTDWGDGGHWQFQPISYLPFAYGAAVSWCLDANRDADPAQLANRYAFRDRSGTMGRIAADLGNAYKETGVEFGNSTAFYILLQRYLDKPLDAGSVGQLSAEKLERTIAYIDAQLARLDGTRMECPDADLIQSEYRMDAALAKFACRLGAARVGPGNVPTSALSTEVRAQLAAELEPLIPEYRQLWLARNRSGGLKESAGLLENLLALLKQ